MFERFTAAAREVVINAQQEARQLGHPYIGTEHVLLALVRGDGAAHDVLVGRGVRLDVARVMVEELVRGRRAG